MTDKTWAGQDVGPGEFAYQRIELPSGLAILYDKLDRTSEGEWTYFFGKRAEVVVRRQGAGEHRAGAGADRGHGRGDPDETRTRAAWRAAGAAGARRACLHRARGSGEGRSRRCCSTRFGMRPVMGSGAASGRRSRPWSRTMPKPSETALAMHRLRAHSEREPAMRRLPYEVSRAETLPFTCPSSCPHQGGRKRNIFSPGHERRRADHDHRRVSRRGPRSTMSCGRLTAATRIASGTLI